MQQDIKEFVFANYEERDVAAVFALLTDAKDHTESPATDRMLRCALVASKASLRELEKLVELLAQDYRDVIVAGEYESIEGQLTQIRDLAQPFTISNT